MKILSPIVKLNENFNISNALCTSSRILYPKLAKKCKTDLLLSRRLQLKVAEEKSLLLKSTTLVPEVNNFLCFKKLMLNSVFIKH